MRATITTGGAASGDAVASLRVYEGSSNNSPGVILQESAILALGAGDYGLTYLGQLQIPLSSNNSVGVQGRGIAVERDTADLYIEIVMRNRINANRIVHLLDIILIPINSTRVLPIQTTNVDGIVSDSTGYFSRGRAQLGIAFPTVANTDTGSIAQLSGGFLTLDAKKNQRLYFLMQRTNAASERTSQPNQDMIVRANIVPRWIGVRDV